MIHAQTLHEPGILTHEDAQTLGFQAPYVYWPPYHSQGPEDRSADLTSDLGRVRSPGSTRPSKTQPRSAWGLLVADLQSSVSAGAGLVLGTRYPERLTGRRKGRAETTVHPRDVSRNSGVVQVECNHGTPNTTYGTYGTDTGTDICSVQMLPVTLAWLTWGPVIHGVSGFYWLVVSTRLSNISTRLSNMRSVVSIIQVLEFFEQAVWRLLSPPSTSQGGKSPVSPVRSNTGCHTVGQYFDWQANGFWWFQARPTSLRASSPNWETRL